LQVKNQGTDRNLKSLKIKGELTNTI